MNPSYSITYTPLAYEDLVQIYLYIRDELGAPLAARGQVDRIRKAARSLSSFPQKHEAVDWEPWKSASMHKLPVNHYVIFYEIQDSSRSVLIVRIFYGGRNIQRLVSQQHGLDRS